MSAGPSRDGLDHAGELGAGDPRELGLVLIFAADLQEVEEVGGGSVYLDEVEGGMGLEIGEGDDTHVVGPFEVGRDLDSPHDGEAWEGV